MQTLPIELIHRGLCPYCRRVRAYLAEKELAVELTAFDPEEHQQRLGHLNPHHEVPTAVLRDGTALYDSLLFMEYLEDAHPTPRLMPEDALARAKTRLLFDAASTLGGSLPGFVRAPKDHPERLRRAAELAQNACLALPLLAEEGDFALGESFSFADLSLPPLLLRAMEAGLDPDSLPTRIRRWTAAVLRRPSVAALYPNVTLTA